MTNEQKAVIRRLRQQNSSYVSIANTLSPSALSKATASATV